MFNSDEKFVFIEKISGISNKTNNPYLMFQIANPRTFENMTIQGAPVLNQIEFGKGELVKLAVEIGERFGNTSVTLCGIEPWKS